jgi:hypothetical protein
MVKKTTKQTGKRMRRDDPDRETADRRASGHIRRNAGSQNGGKRGNGEDDSKRQISDTVQQAISGMVRQSSAFIEEQIRAGQQAAERLRDGIANSKELNTDVNALVEHLVATTKDVGTTWLELISIIVRALGTQPPNGGGSNGGGKPHTPPGPGATVTQSGKSGGATTFSSMTPAESSVAGIPPRIVVNGPNVKSVALDLRPPSLQFVPMVQQLTVGDRDRSAKAKSARSIDAKFSRSFEAAGIILTVNVPGGMAPGTYTGAVVDSKTNQAGGTLSVTVAN